jgi:hypothetical protein
MVAIEFGWCIEMLKTEGSFSHHHLHLLPPRIQLQLAKSATDSPETERRHFKK